MARGQPDFGAYASTDIISGMSDLGELAARLGSPDVFDRKGNVIFIDSFESDLIPYEATTSGAGGEVVVTTEYSRMGAFSCRLTHGSDLSRQAGINKFLPYPVLSKMGFELAFTLNDSIDYYLFRFIIYKGLQRYAAVIEYYPATTTLRYQDIVGAWQTISTTLDLYEDVYQFHLIKIITDFVNDKYDKIIINEKEFSLAGIDLLSFAGALRYQIQAGITNFGFALANETCYIDEFIVTQNEP